MKRSQNGLSRPRSRRIGWRACCAGAWLVVLMSSVVATGASASEARPEGLFDSTLTERGINVTGVRPHTYHLLLRTKCSDLACRRLSLTRISADGHGTALPTLTGAFPAFAFRRSRTVHPTAGPDEGCTLVLYQTISITFVAGRNRFRDLEDVGARILAGCRRPSRRIEIRGVGVRVSADGTLHPKPTAHPKQPVYVAMGDSYQSGEGTFKYTAATKANNCHRSPYAYAHLLTAPLFKGKLKFFACSGAKIRNLYHGQNGEKPQMDSLKAYGNDKKYDVTAVTVGIGGDDLGFKPLLVRCVTHKLSGNDGSPGSDCTKGFKHISFGTLERKLSKVYRDIHSRAPRAQIYVIGYPHFFHEASAFPNRCSVRVRDKAHINALIKKGDQHIARAVKRAQNLGDASQFHFIDTYGAFNGHDLCGSPGDDYINGLVSRKAKESFHPNKAGHKRLAQIIDATQVNIAAP